MDEQLQTIFHDVFGVAPADFHPGLDADSVEAWDSVMHLTLLLTLEQKFGVSFEPEVGLQLTSVAAIKTALSEAMGERG